MYWQLWPPFALGFIGLRLCDWLDEYYRLSIPYMILIGWSLGEFFLCLAEHA
jgi:hypothetical protein